MRRSSAEFRELVDEAVGAVVEQFISWGSAAERRALLLVSRSVAVL